MNSKGITMKLNLKALCKSLLIAVIGFTFVNCGGGQSNTVRIVTNGQTHELSIRNNRCDAGLPSGNGIYNLPIVCSGGFANTSGLADSIVVTITDVRAIRDSLGQFVSITPSLLLMNFTLDGNQLAVSNGGAVFSEVSNQVGGRTCFEFQIDSAQAHIEGNFCGNIGTGF